MSSADISNSASQPPSFWIHAMRWMRSIPRAAWLSLIGPSILLVVGYFGWRFFRCRLARPIVLRAAQENIVVPPQPRWIKTSIVDQVYDGCELSRYSVLESQTTPAVAAAFNAHPWIRKTHRVVKIAGKQLIVDLEYRYPVAMVYCEVDGNDPAASINKERYLPVDSDGVLLPTKDFTSTDVPSFIHIYLAGPGIKISEDLKVGTQIESRVVEATLLCRLIARYREPYKIDRVNVYPSNQVGKSKWLLEIETKGGPRIIWGHAPGFESVGEPAADLKLRQLADIASDQRLWNEPKHDLSAKKGP